MDQDFEIRNPPRTLEQRQTGWPEGAIAPQGHLNNPRPLQLVEWTRELKRVLADADGSVKSAGTQCKFSAVTHSSILTGHTFCRF